jgi:hypothetical protein
MAIGSDAPSFVVYESGLVIYKVIEDKKMKFNTVKLNSDELRNLINYILPSDEIYEIDEEIEASSWTDQPENILVINMNKKKVIDVYGNLSDNEVRNITPQLFVEIYDKIMNYNNKFAQEWKPPFIEVMLWDYDYAPNKRQWPENFPDLNSSSTLKHGNMYSIYIENKQQLEFLKFYRSIREKECVEINGKKMSISYRMPFPNIDYKID